MSDEALAVVFRTAQYGEAAALTAMLNDAGIPAEMLGAQHSTMVLAGGGEAFAIRIVVGAEREAEAVALIEAYMHSIGAAPASEEPESAAPDEALLACPNCEAEGVALKRPCAGCGFVMRPLQEEPPTVKSFAAGARTFCPECRDPLTFPSGKCAGCGEELEPLENGDRLCPELKAHVLYRDTVGGAVCKVCRAVWLELA